MGSKIDRYREAGAEVIEVLSGFSRCVERASIDEAYIDLTEEVDKRIGALEVEEISTELLSNTHVIGFEPKEEVEQGKRSKGLMHKFISQ